MPGWPSVDRAEDHELVEALRRADSDAPAKLYDSYAERLHDYAASFSRDLAADAVHDALVTAQGCVHRLKEPARLRAWLYALTKFQVRARLAHRDTSVSLPPPLPEEQDDPELADLVHEALGELKGIRREILELSLRHGLTPAEVGAVLGLTSRQATSRLARARDHLENAAAAVVLARIGRAHCPDLSAMLDSWEGPLTPLLRRRLSGHIGRCEVCTEGRHRQVSAARLLDMVPVAFPPISLRRRVIDTCVDPGLDQTRTLITDRGDDFDRAGFPVAAERGARRRGPRRLAPVLLAGACVLAATGAVVAINGGGASDDTPLRAAAPSPTPSLEETFLESPEPDPEEDELTPVSTPTPSRTPSRRATPAAERPRARQAPEPRTPTRGRAPAARLRTSCPKAVEGAAKVRLAARGATVSWTATGSTGLDVFPASGSIKAGRSVAIWVTVLDPGEAGRGRVTFTSNGGGGSCALSWDAQTPRPQEPTGEPTPPAEPTALPPSQNGPENGPGNGAGNSAGNDAGNAPADAAGSRDANTDANQE
ncbi:sigma-70 family RNA polymerase sigma factor [Nonomuraea phyllanthi]|uniref:Sigma-70 family RNA polymerase sigma factor n=1 Tax=Nonomuraea phyllanthi TaxID=2219224 RepID=A0A5C4WH72_9ACTN|nr:sigma-70 family RNA polymerase sigma factor [Nonomuraea phyllanthi]KAB8193452.1 sigma-70 family RNA polymerase sigma factor [Nonomuraea phyllanthi]